MFGSDEILKHNLRKAQKGMKTLADQHQREASFEVGDYAFVKLQPYRQNFTTLFFETDSKKAIQTIQEAFKEQHDFSMTCNIKELL